MVECMSLLDKVMDGKSPKTALEELFVEDQEPVKSDIELPLSHTLEMVKSALTDLECSLTLLKLRSKNDSVDEAIKLLSEIEEMIGKVE